MEVLCRYIIRYIIKGFRFCDFDRIKMFVFLQTFSMEKCPVTSIRNSLLMELAI